METNGSKMKQLKTLTPTRIKQKIQAKDALPNIKRTQASEMAEKCHVFPGDLDL